MNETMTCAVCHRAVAPDSDHVEIEAEEIRMRDMNDHDEYWLHQTCWWSISDGWRRPA